MSTPATLPVPTVEEQILTTLESDHRPFSTRELADSAEGSYGYVRKVLSQLAQRGEVERIQDGLYRAKTGGHRATEQRSQISAEPRTPLDIDAEAEPPGRYSHLVQAGATWDYELTDPESGTVRAAVQIRFMVAPDVRRRSLSSAPAGGASADPSQARSAS